MGTQLLHSNHIIILCKFIVMTTVYNDFITIMYMTRIKYYSQKVRDYSLRND